MNLYLGGSGVQFNTNCKEHSCRLWFWKSFNCFNSPPRPTPLSLSFSLSIIFQFPCSPNHCHGKGCVIPIDQWILPTEYFNELLILFPFPLILPSIWPNLPKKQNWELVIVVEGGTQLTSPELGLCWKLITFSSEMTPTLPPSPQFRSDTSFAVRCARFELAKKYRAPKIRPCAGYGWPKYSPIGLEAPLWPQQHPPIQRWT